MKLALPAMSAAPLPVVEPMPPRMRATLPWIGSGLDVLRNPTEFFREGRRRLGDTFVVDAFGWRLFCVFSPEGVKRLYDLPEREASFGLATFQLIKSKVPTELLVGRRNTPHRLFAQSDVERYLGNLEEAVRCELDELGPSGTFEIFGRMRRLGHRLGFASWAGREAASPRYLDRLIPLYDLLDSSDSFVRPVQTALTYATGKWRERRALREIELIVAEILRERERTGHGDDDFLAEIDRSFADLPREERERGVARDVVMLHMGAQSNLYAALAWTLVNVLLHPEHRARIEAGDDTLLESCANESIRMAQRSITLRQVLQPVKVDDGRTTYTVAPGAMIATMLSVTNTSSAPGLESFDPSHYDGRKLGDHISLPARELVSTFGHGRHSCPAQRFAISAIRIAIRRLLDRYDLQPDFREAQARPRQLGAVARAAGPCPVRYRARAR
jgi:cytochrome P450